MKKTLYWGCTLVLVALMISNAVYFAGHLEAFTHLGLPSWFRWELTVAKVLGVIALLAPVPRLVREFAYFGFALTIVSADIAHLSSGDSAWFIPAHLAFLGMLVTSYVLKDDPAVRGSHARTLAQPSLG